MVRWVSLLQQRIPCFSNPAFSVSPVSSVVDSSPGKKSDEWAI